MQISVIVPVYKGNKHIKNLLNIMNANVATIKAKTESFCNEDFELILVNDSPDIPIEIPDIKSDDYILRVIDNPHNLGIQGARINGINNAKGEFIQMLDQDDKLADNALYSQLTAIGDCDMVIANGYSESESENYKEVLYTSVSQQKMALEPKYYYSIGCMIWSPGQCLIRKSAIPQVWMQEKIEHNGSDDLLLWLLMQNEGCKVTINPEKLYTHVETGVNYSADFEKITTSSMDVLDFLKKHSAVSKKLASKFERRFEMRKLYHGKSFLHKAVAMLLYPDLSWPLVVKKVRGKLR
ncbi:MAG: glycosyltransferase family 2 protein [Oscillospiraceae bacterium]|nr:glycosyltransferase family 2 protein [Oscillospiraceae bacterium]